MRQYTTLEGTGMNGSKWRMFGIPAASFAALMTGAVAWGQLDLPRPAWHSEVQALSLQVAANTQLILGDKWLRLTAQIKSIEAELKGNIEAEKRQELHEKLAIKQLQLREVNGKLN